MKREFVTFADFYSYYLREHSKTITKLFHFIGTFLFIIFFILYIESSETKYIVIGPVCGYGFAWFSHFFFENNKPATFKYPFYSLIADFYMFYQIITGKIKIF